MTELREPVAAAKAARSVLFRASSQKLTVRQHRVLAAVIAYTALYNRRSDRVFLAQLASFAFGVEQAAPWQLKRTAEALRELSRLGLVESTPPRGRPPGLSGPAYAIRLIETDPNLGATSTEKSTPILVRKAPRSWSETDPAPGGPTEEVPEEIPEGGRASALARRLVTAAHDELPTLLEQLNTAHHPGPVLAQLEQLTAEGARYRWPSELRTAITTNLRTTTPPTHNRTFHPAVLAAQVTTCTDPECINGWINTDDDTVTHCPTCHPQAITA